MQDDDLVRLHRLIRELGDLTRKAHEASRGIPAARRNLYLMLRHIEMLEMEISDPIEVLPAEPPSESEEI